MKMYGVAGLIIIAYSLINKEKGKLSGLRTEI